MRLSHILEQPHVFFVLGNRTIVFYLLNKSMLLEIVVSHYSVRVVWEDHIFQQNMRAPPYILRSIHRWLYATNCLSLVLEVFFLCNRIRSIILVAL